MNLSLLFVVGLLLLLSLTGIGMANQKQLSISDNAGHVPYSTNIERDTLTNSFYRKVLYTSPTLQLVLMSLLPRQEIGMEQHAGLTQFIRSERGEGLAIVDGQSYPLRDGEIIVIPPNAKHNIINLSDREHLQLYTIYAPPHHPPGTLHPDKSDEPHEH